MADMLQVHNTEAEGYHPHDVGDDSRPRHGIWTRKNYRPETVRGNRVWVVRAVGSPRRYSLCYTFIVDGMDKQVSPFHVFGDEGESFDPEIPLDHKSGWFKSLYERLNNFSLGFSTIDDTAAGEFERLRQEYCQR